LTVACFLRVLVGLVWLRRQFGVYMEELRCELIVLLTDEPTCVWCMEQNDLTIKMQKIVVEARFPLLLHHRLYKIEWASMQVAS
jgi:hypothetical protein